MEKVYPQKYSTNKESFTVTLLNNLLAENKKW